MLTKIAIILALLVVLIGMFRNRKTDRPSRTTNILLVIVIALLGVSLLTHFLRMN